MPDLPDLVAGHNVLDWVNTVSWRLDPARRTERLPDLPALLAWCRRAELVDTEAAAAVQRAATDEPVASAAALRAVNTLREAVYTIVRSTLGVPRQIDRELATLRAATLDGVRHATLAGPPPLRWALHPRVPADLPRLLALRSLDLLRSPSELREIRECAGAGCGRLFLDRSRSHTRRWCSADTCGNRARARRHFLRIRDTRATG